MQGMSDEYKTQIEYPQRNPTHIRIRFGIIDTDAPGLSNISSNGHADFCNIDSLDQGVTVNAPYATLEQNRWSLNGRFALPTLEAPTYQGFIGSELSDTDGFWITNPSISVDFDDYVTFAGLTFQFDDGYGWYPSSFRVEAIHDSSVVYSKTVEPDNEFYAISEAVPPCNHLILTWLQNNKPYSRARILSLIYGLVTQRTDETLTGCEVDREIDLLNSSFPKCKFNFTMFDPDGEYDPENPDGVWEYLETRQPVTTHIGYELDSGAIEWMLLSTTYTTGNVNVQGTGKSLNIEIESESIVSHLTQTYDEGKYYAGGRSLYDLANDLMAFSGFAGTATLDSALQSIITYQPLPVSSVNSLLQMIASAGRCVLDVTRGGTVSILRHAGTISDFDMTFAKMMEFPKTTKIPPLKYINFKYKTIVPATELSEVITNYEVDVAESKEFTFSHLGITGHTVSVSGLTVIGTPLHYAYKTVITLVGTGTITIKGYALEENEVQLSKRYGDVGENLDSLENRLITDAINAEAFIDWVADVTQRRNTYAVKDRGYPELDVGDNIGFVTTYQSNINVTVLSQKITYNGAIQGSGKYLIQNEI